MQGLVIPDQTYDELSPVDSTFRCSPRQSVDIHDKKPSRELADADADADADANLGFKAAAFVGGWDVSVNYLRHYRDEARLEERNGILIGSYYRSTLVGATASKAFGDSVLRLEVGRDSDYWVATENTHRSRTSAVVGLDYSGVSETFLSVQYFVARFASDSVERASFLATRDLYNDTFKLEMLAIHDLAEGDGVVQVDTAYQLTSSLVIKLGADFFYGSARADFGQFDDQDRVRLGLELSF